MDTIQQEKTEKILEKVKQFTLFDDDYMKAFFNEDIPCTQFVLRTILKKDDLIITRAKTQEEISNLKGRSIRLDIAARDSSGKPYDIEIQKVNEGAGARRARYNSGDDTEKLSETYVIFITENDIYEEGLPLYIVERYINGKKLFNDGSHIIYVNGKYRGDDPIGDLMHDFSCSKTSEMKNKILADKNHQLKEEGHMCKIMEDFAKEEREEERIELALKNLEKGSINESQIGDIFSLTPEQVSKVLELYHSRVAVQA